MKDYIAYPDIKKTLEVLSKSYMLGIISDTWPSIEQQLEAIGVLDIPRLIKWRIQFNVSLIRN